MSTVDLREKNGAKSFLAFPARERGAESFPAFPAREQGAALLTVLLLVAVMAVVSATAVERLTLATRLAASAAGIEQARHFTLAGEALALRRIDTLLERGGGSVTLDGDWHGKPFVLPLPGGSAELTLTDAGNCFNLNSLVAESTVGGSAQRPLAIEQYVALMQALGIERSDADRIAAGTGDWIDADQNETPLGAEDAVYAGASPPYRTADAPMVDASELTAIAGVSPQLWRQLSRWTCALPTNDLSPININTLLPDQAPLMQMLLPIKLSPAQARAHLAARPVGGYGSLNRFWTAPTLGGATPSGDVASQVKLTTRWFHLTTVVRLGDVSLTSDALIDAGDKASIGAGTAPARVVRRRWGAEN